MSRITNFLSDRLFGYLKFFYGYLGTSVFVMLVASMMVAVLDGIGLTMFVPLLQTVDGTNEASAEDMGPMGFVLTAFEAVGLELTLVSVLVVMLTFFCLKGVAKFLADYYRIILRQRFAIRIRIQSMKLFAGYDYLAFTQADSGRIQNVFSGEVERITKSYVFYFSMLQSAIMTLVYVAAAYLANPRFALIVAVGGLVSNLAFSRIYRITKESSRGVSKRMNEFQGFLIESVASFKFLKATDLITPYRDKVNNSILGIEKEQRRVGTMGALSGAMREPLIMLIVVIAILIQVRYYQESLSLIILSLLFFYRGLTSLVATQAYYNSFLGVSGSIDNVASFVEELQETQELFEGVEHKHLQKGFECNDLSYSYGNAKVLDGIYLTLKKNETLGIVGGSGVGKTTFVNILCGLLKVEPGMLVIDGKDSNDIDIRSYRARIGYVTQESQVFKDTVFNNVSFWDVRNKVTEEKARRALVLAHAAEFVDQLPDGIDTPIGINGVNLSGGQRQRISIARELYREVDILVLDEATSSLDTESERLIQENVESLAGSYTMMIIAHRLSTIRQADKIIHFKDRGNYEIGSFDELMEKSPAFRRMVDLQTVS